jgi:hypothetical protein
MMDGRNLPESIDTAVTMPTDLMFDETDAASDIDVLSESDNDDVFDETDSPTVARKQRSHGRELARDSSLNDDDDEDAGNTMDDVTNTSDFEDCGHAGEDGRERRKEHKKKKKAKDKKHKNKKTKATSEGGQPGGLHFDDDDIPPDMDEDQDWLHRSDATLTASDEDIERGTH